MVPVPYLLPLFYNNERIKKLRGFDLNTSVYSFPNYMSTPVNSSSACFNPFLDEARNHKRLKQTQSTEESLTSDGTLCCKSATFDSDISYGSTGSLNSLPKLHFRDHVWAYTQRYLAVVVMEEAALIHAEEGYEVKQEGSLDGMRLVQLLIACAEAVACRDKSQASMLLSELCADALVFGTSFQRIASCFVKGLSDCLSLVQPLGAVGFVGPTLETTAVSSEKEEALSLVYEVYPQIQFGHFVANASILEAFEGESSVHVVDLGMTLGLSHGHQWRILIHSLVNRAGQPPRLLLMTGVGNCAECLHAMGDEKERYAHILGLNFEFSLVESNLEDMKPENIKTPDAIWKQRPSV